MLSKRHRPRSPSRWHKRLERDWQLVLKPVCLLVGTEHIQNYGQTDMRWVAINNENTRSICCSIDKNQHQHYEYEVRSVLMYKATLDCRPYTHSVILRMLHHDYHSVFLAATEPPEASSLACGLCGWPVKITDHCSYYCRRLGEFYPSIQWMVGLRVPQHWWCLVLNKTHSYLHSSLWPPWLFGEQ